MSRRWVPHDTRDQIVDYVNRWTERTEISAQQLHSATGYVTPLDMLEGHQKAIHEERDRKLEQARRTRADRRRQENLQRHEKPRDNRLPLTYPPVSLRMTAFCRETTRAPERCRRQVL
ncbi:MAG UNVERIFIED_CONTAM: hypothetical protein LVR18_06695 [Planctomycetaceae bacterium]